jgi:hypothetical protein
MQVLAVTIWLCNTSQPLLNTTRRSSSKESVSTNKPESPQLVVIIMIAHCSNRSPVCPRLFGNRSFCFEKLQEYEKALTDAQLSINMSPGWDKGLYRMGRALVGLKVWHRPGYTVDDS